MSYARAVVAKLALKYGTRCPYELADHLGIDIVEHPFKKIRGLVLQIHDRTVIGVQSTLPPHEKRAIVAHEIGHQELHSFNIGHFFIREHTYIVPGRLEREADLFAAILLLDRYPHEGETVTEYSDQVEVPARLVKVMWG